MSETALRRELEQQARYWDEKARKVEDTGVTTTYGDLCRRNAKVLRKAAQALWQRRPTPARRGR